MSKHQSLPAVTALQGVQPDPMLPDAYSLNFKLLVVGLEVYRFSFKRFLLDPLVPEVYNFNFEVSSLDAEVYSFNFNVSLPDSLIQRRAHLF